MINAKLFKRLAAFALAGVAMAYVYRWSPYKVEFLGHYDKIWAHRVNSTEKLSSAISYFEGVELDLVYLEAKDILDVNHPPAESIDLDFQDYLNALEDDEQPFLWLDIKNLNADNAQSIISKLLQIFNAKRYPLNKVLVETQQPEALPIFEQAGFKTSYYLPYGLSKMTTNEFESNIINISKVIREQPDLGISSSYHDYELIAKHFPNQTKYLWALVPTFHTSFKAVKKPLEDETVKVMLIKYNALRGNR